MPDWSWLIGGSCFSGGVGAPSPPPPDRPAHWPVALPDTVLDLPESVGAGWLAEHASDPVIALPVITTGLLPLLLLTVADPVIEAPVTVTPPLLPVSLTAPFWRSPVTSTGQADPEMVSGPVPVSPVLSPQEPPPKVTALATRSTLTAPVSVDAQTSTGPFPDTDNAPLIVAALICTLAEPLTATAPSCVALFRHNRPELAFRAP